MKKFVLAFLVTSNICLAETSVQENIFAGYLDGQYVVTICNGKILNDFEAKCQNAIDSLSEKEKAFARENGIETNYLDKRLLAGYINAAKITFDSLNENSGDIENGVLYINELIKKAYLLKTKMDQ